MIYLGEVYLGLVYLEVVYLAVADLVFIVICVPFTAVIYALPVWPFGTPFCKVCHIAPFLLALSRHK